jgi:uncharacterized protein YlxW (UPF0749 family)
MEKNSSVLHRQKMKLQKEIKLLQKQNSELEEELSKQKGKFDLL